LQVCDLFIYKGCKKSDTFVMSVFFTASPHKNEKENVIKNYRLCFIYSMFLVYNVFNWGDQKKIMFFLCETSRLSL